MELNLVRGRPGFVQLPELVEDLLDHANVSFRHSISWGLYGGVRFLFERPGHGRILGQRFSTYCPCARNGLPCSKASIVWRADLWLDFDISRE